MLKQSAMFFEHNTTAMSTGNRSHRPVVSNRITVSVTVILVTLASMAPAPISAYAPGSTFSLPGSIALADTT